MGGSYRVRREFSRGQANRLALLLSKADSEGKREMQPYLDGLLGPMDFLPYFRRSLRRVLAGDRVKPSVRRELEEFVSEIGSQTHGAGEPNSVPVKVRFSPSVVERIKLAAAGADVEYSVWVREAALMRLNMESGDAEKAGA